MEAKSSYGVWIADNAGAEKIADGAPFLLGQMRHEAVDRRRKAATVCSQNAEDALIGAAGQELRFVIGRCGDQRHPIIT